MFDYPYEKFGLLRFYKYKFRDIEEQVTVEAFNRKEARQLLWQFVNNNERFFKIPVINETVSHPIEGETKKKINNIEHVWVGGEQMWMPLWEYKRKNNIYDDDDDEEEELYLS